MDSRASLQAQCAPAELFVHVEDLSRYPAWVDLVHRAERIDSPEPEWDVELRARLGPFARSKRLRMRRTVHDVGAHVAVFERHEVDGRSHSPWVLRAEVVEAGDGSELRMHLHYGGGLWTGGVLERSLSDQIRQGRERLAALVRPTH
ncbi:MAG: SRPBCC family protein [Acidobacteria bacterium]|nr:SRPBCC family protein [Acidobacteriota bacterium]